MLRHIAKLCRADTYRPKAPYAPGVTGTALSMADRARLLDPDVRARMPGAQALFEALHGAIGHNLLRAHKDRSVKNNRWMVLYLNRLTCVRYGLPLGYGGFRERPLEEMCRWMLGDTEDVIEPALQESLRPRDESLGAPAAARRRQLRRAWARPASARSCSSAARVSTRGPSRPRTSDGATERRVDGWMIELPEDATDLDVRPLARGKP